MNEPSPEAKPTGWHYKPVSLVGSPKATRFSVYDESGEPIVSVYMRSDAERICNTVNTATAKAREELETWRHRAIGANLPTYQQPSALVREKWEAMLVAEVKRYGGIPYLNNEELEFREAMAGFLLNQQPSAPIQENNTIQFELDNPLPSAPTAGVEDWSLVQGVPSSDGDSWDSDGDSWDIYEGNRRIAFDLMNEEAGPIVAMHNTALAQACAPLVEALKWYATAQYPDDGSGRPPEAFQRRAKEALALTGTGENVTKTKGTLPHQQGDVSRW